MSVRFLADADLNYAIVQGVHLREPAIDFKSANDGRLQGLSDPEVLELAAREERVLVSHDKSTMPVHFAAMAGAGLRVLECCWRYRVPLWARSSSLF